MIYVDELREYQGPPKPDARSVFGNRRPSCHMATDGDIEELHVFAESIGLRREWFQAEASTPHYDLTPRKREAAVTAGARSVTTMELISRCRVRK